MPKNVQWTLTVQVTGGPKISASGVEEVNAYDLIEVDIEDEAHNKSVEVQPGGSGQVEFFLLEASPYSEDGKLTYKVNDVSSTPIELDAQQLLMGHGAMGMLGEAPKRLLFSNSLGKVASVRILVGRNAITKTEVSEYKSKPEPELKPEPEPEPDAELESEPKPEPEPESEYE